MYLIKHFPILLHVFYQLVSSNGVWTLMYNKATMNHLNNAVLIFLPLYVAPFISHLINHVMHHHLVRSNGATRKLIGCSTTSYRHSWCEVGDSFKVLHNVKLWVQRVWQRMGLFIQYKMVFYIANNMIAWQSGFTMLHFSLYCLSLLFTIDSQCQICLICLIAV